MKVNASSLRKNIYRLLDHVLETGEPLEVERNGMLLKVLPQSGKSDKFSRLVHHDCMKGDPEDLVHLDWSDEWSEG